MRKWCVKFGARRDIITINRHKHNLEDNDSVEDFIPPALQDLENLLIRKGAEVRAERSAAGFPVRTRRVWQNGSRILQSKDAVAGSTYRTIFGNHEVGRPVLSTEMDMVFSDYCVPPNHDHVSTND